MGREKKPKFHTYHYIIFESSLGYRVGLSYTADPVLPMPSALTAGLSKQKRHMGDTPCPLKGQLPTHRREPQPSSMNKAEINPEALAECFLVTGMK